MQEPIKLNFSIENGSNLNVNLYTYKNDSGTIWYSLVKKETIIHNGKLIKPSVHYSNLIYHEIHIFNKKIAKSRTLGHVLKDGFFEKNYTFTENHIDFKIYKNGGLYSSRIISYEKDLEELENNISFVFYNPNKAEFELTPLSIETLNILDSMTFEELLETSKLLEKDIQKLNNFSEEQKNKLIEAHNKKVFNRIEHD